MQPCVDQFWQFTAANVTQSHVVKNGAQSSPAQFSTSSASSSLANVTQSRMVKNGAQNSPLDLLEHNVEMAIDYLKHFSCFRSGPGLLAPGS